MKSSRDICQMRVSIPLRSLSAYLFVDPDSETKRHPWWRELWDLLETFASSRLEWVYEPVQEVFTSTPELTDENRMLIASFIQGAPRDVIESNQTIRLGLKCLVSRYSVIEIMFFSLPDEGEQRTPRSGAAV